LGACPQAGLRGGQPLTLGRAGRGVWGRAPENFAFLLTVWYFLMFFDQLFSPLKVFFTRFPAIYFPCLPLACRAGTEQQGKCLILYKTLENFEFLNPNIIIYV
jgi:hypothetical protein